MRIQIKKQGGGGGMKTIVSSRPFLLVRRRQVNINAHTLERTFNRTKTVSCSLNVAADKVQKTFFFLQGIWFRRRLEISLSEEFSIKHESIHQLFCIINMAMFDLLFPSCSSLCVMHGLYLKLKIQLFFSSKIIIF